MRFVENGPSLPPHLIEEQAQGNVIFFCGAGVSMPAGLDSFWALTNRIIDTLDATKARKALADKESFDRVFNVLVREFGREEIDSQIYVALGGGKPRTLKHHRDILALSRGASGNPQIVTTNFDRLFEQAGRDVRPIVPPGLPDIELNQPIRGVVYLHGRLADPRQPEEIPSYVIGSSDFGRAYLAEGWATRFVKALREKYTIVLLLPHLEGIEAGLAALSELRDKPAGKIRLTAVDHAAETILWPALAKFLAEYPDIQIDLVVDNTLQDRHLGARIGITAVLHTWGSAMTHHPHVYMIVPGGGIALDGSRWISSRPAFLLPVHVLGNCSAASSSPG